MHITVQPIQSMRLFILKFSAFWLCAFLCLACQNDPDFPKEPIISLESLKRKFDTTSSDSVLLAFRFQDGNGDLGILPEERKVPRPLNRITANGAFHLYNYTFNNSGQVIDSTLNKFSKNMFVEVYKRNAQGQFQLVVFPDNLDFSAAFPPLYEGKRRSPMEGTIRYAMRFLPPLFSKGDHVRIQLQIADRERNLSNIVSDTLTLRFQ